MEEPIFHSCATLLNVLTEKEFLLSLVCVPICKEISRIGEQATLLITLTRHCLTKSLFSYIQALQRTANFIRDGQDLRFSNFVQVPLPLIPMDEQKEIAEYLNKETARIDSIIADITEQIEKLKEYRQSVISEVVTGKVAVE